MEYIYLNATWHPLSRLMLVHAYPVTGCEYKAKAIHTNRKICAMSYSGNNADP